VTEGEKTKYRSEILRSEYTQPTSLEGLLKFCVMFWFDNSWHWWLCCSLFTV